MTAATAERQSIGIGLGASEIAAAAGLDPFRSPLQLWLEHTGQAPAFEGNEHTEWGLEVEPAILRWYERRLDDGEALLRPTASIYRPASEWKRCTPDGIVCHTTTCGEPLRVVQVKNVGHRMSHRWWDGPPDYTVCQVQWELHVLGLDRGDVCASVGGTPPETWTLWRDQKMIDDLDAIAERHWRHVQDRTEPRTTHHADWATYLAQRSKKLGFVVPADSAPESLVDDWRAATHDERRAIERCDLAKNRVRRFLADAGADAMETPYGLATWRETKKGNRTLRAPKGFSGE